MSVDQLSDPELRTKLAEYGYPVGPVTQTTRKILVKKLKALIEARESGASRTTANRHSLAARYSSDDTDDDTVSGAGRNKKKTGSSRRQTMANPMPPPPSAPPAAPRSPAKRKTPVRVATIRIEDPPINVEPFVRKDMAQRENARSSPEMIKSTKSVQRKVTKMYSSTSTVNDGLETGSDSDVNEDPEKIYGAKKFVVNGPKSYGSGLSDQGVSGDYKPAVKPYEPKQHSVFTTREENFVTPVFQPNVSPILPVKDDGYGRESKNWDDPLANVETPYLSDFTRRLSRLSSANLPAASRTRSNSPILHHSSTSIVPDVKETDSNGHFTLRSTYPFSTTSSRYTSSPVDRPRDIVTRAFQPTTDSKDAKNNQNFISMVLVAVVALFFAVLAVVYLGLGGKTETFPPELSDNNIPLCTPEQPDGNRPGVHCVMRDDLESVQRLLKRLQPILTQKAITAACDNPNDAPYLTDKNVISIFSSKEEWEVKQDLHNAQVLIFNNPKWGISLVEVDESDKTSIRVLDSMEKVFLNRVDGKVGMVILNPELPMKCLAANKLYTVLSSLLIVAFGLLIAIGVYKSVIWYLNYKKRLESDVFHMVSEIITTLELHHQNAAVASPGGSQESYLAINHVRDNLISPKDRKRLAGLWQKAVKFLDENESRVRREVQQVAGEEFHVWRWLPSNNLNASNVPAGSPANKKTKVWQGQAFETMEGSVNSLPCSPTPCLKIRHMFDPDVEFEEDWETKVQDAILEKCGEDVKILHIRVDRGSREGCVYMKCMSQEDAGKAYRALHGWWFDSNLVTVKYLRLERYHERFPDAIRCVTPLKPSNNQRLSMQSHYWQSPLETN